MVSTVKSLDEQLIDACHGEGELDMKNILGLLKKGASAKHERYIDGTWGAGDRYSAIHGVLKQKNWQARKQAAISVKIIAELFKHGALANATEEHTNWKGSGSTLSAFQMAFSIVLNENEEILDLQQKLLVLFLDNAADPHFLNTHHIASMRSDGTLKSPVWHRAVEGAKVKIVEALANSKYKFNVDQEACGWVSNERGYDRDYKYTALHLACELKSHVSAFQMAYILLEAGADPNKLSIELDVVSRTDIAYDENYVDDPRSAGYEPPVESFRVIETPIHTAIRSQNVPLAWLLIKFGADYSRPAIRCRRNEFAKRTFGRDESIWETQGKVIESDEEIYNSFVSKNTNREYVLSTERIISNAKQENSEDMQNAMKGELPDKYQNLITPKMNLKD